ncbi:hypothetical protein JHK84_054400 [Glycine max]|nr:hypothetical protein JHK85_055337 [Glycine max]KAG5084362.1 hypothetical protein JHK84_054400 [Glycine max]
MASNFVETRVLQSSPVAVLATDEKYNEAIFSTANRLVAAIDGLPDPGWPKFKDNKRESNFKSREETDEKCGQFTLVVGGLLVIAFVVPMAQYYAYVSKNYNQCHVTLGLEKVVE